MNASNSNLVVFGNSHHDGDTGLAMLMIMLSVHGIVADEAQLRHQFGVDKFDTTRIILAAQFLGATAKVVTQQIDRLDKAPLPAIAMDRNGEFFILAKLIEKTPGHKQAIIQRFNSPPQQINFAELMSTWTKELIFITSKANYARDTANFDFTWFIPAIVKYRKLLTEVLIISLALQIIALVTPLFFQIIMDKVLVNHAMKTLNVIAIGLICATLFEAILTGLRTWIFSHTSSKIDVELGARLFRHLLALPLAYFHSRRVGDSVARIRELENIRAFLTGNAITLVLDLLFSIIFILVMLLYSVQLTLIVLASIVLYTVISLVFTPIIRARLDEKFNKGSENQSFLVETISGIDTLKAMAVEPRWMQKWDQQLAAYVSASLSANNVSTFASSGVTLVSKLVTAAIMWMGATLVIDNKLTVGELVAFNMLAGQVSTPILRLAQLWNDFQQVGISIHRLGDILNTPTEIIGQKSRLPRLEGAITFDQVTFRYRPDSADVLRRVSLHIHSGEVIGIVGRSGSGKSTLGKMLQRLFVPQSGRILVDGQDISIVDTASLRRQIGVVTQENVLFNRSIRDNIALTDPSHSIETIIQAAKLAGAHEFICELPEAYDTLVGEHGTGLSGGQRQRIAIARALISNPRIVIFDEATSALDYESEDIIQKNMAQICEGRTVLIIAHRLTAVRDANRIVVMDSGQIVEIGSHEELVEKENGIYARLHQLQRGGSQ